MRETDARFFEHPAVLHDAAQPAAASRPLPGVAAETGAAVQLLELGHDAALQTLQVVLDLFQLVHWTAALSIAPVFRSRISEGPDAGPQSPGTM